MLTIKEVDLRLKLETEYITSNTIKLAEETCDTKFWDKESYKNRSESNIREIINLWPHFPPRADLPKLYLIKNNNQNIGSFVAQKSPTVALKNSSNVLLISNFYIEKKYRGVGHGSKAVSELFQDTLIKKGITSFEVEVDTKNDDGINFWESLGFETFRKRMVKINP